MNLAIRFKCASVMLTAILASACSHTPDRAQPDSLSSPGDATLSQVQQQDVERALRYADQGKQWSALRVLERLAEQQPRHPELWANLATLYYQLEQPDACAKALERAQQLAPESAQALNLEGTLALDRGELERARERFEQALESQPDHADAHYNLALIYDTYHQNLSRAVHHYQAYLQFSDEPDEITEDWLKQLKGALDRQQTKEEG